MEALWKSILDLLSRVVTPDWGELIKLIPVALLAVVALFFALTVRRYATVGPARRAPARFTPIAPPDIHMPGPSYSPVLAALGMGALFWGLVVGGTALWVGLAILVFALLYWGREAIHEYDQAARAGGRRPEHRAGMLPTVIHAGPPPGVHMPGPSFRPILGAIGTAAVLVGLVFGGWLLAAGLITFVVTLVGWLPDARAEYDKAVEADTTGHLENPPPPAWPRRLLQAGVVLFAVAVLFQTGILPPRSAATDGTATGSPGPSASEAPTATAFTIAAKDIAFDVKAIVVKADAPFTIDFANNDVPGVTHNIEIRATDGTTVVQTQDVINGGASVNYQYKALAAGRYVFICSIHPVPSMTGTITVK
ncbi:MAG: cupredoxin domain-containing protein [Chloroflexota bacterium]